MIIDNNKPFDRKGIKHLFNENLKGRIALPARCQHQYPYNEVYRKGGSFSERTEYLPGADLCL